jgi:hypothetical protein
VDRELGAGNEGGEPSRHLLSLRLLLELFTSGSIKTTRRNDTGTVEIDGEAVSVFFSPGDGRAIDLGIAQKIGPAQRRLLIASMDVSSGTILGAINDSIARSGLTVDGIFDRTQMEGVIKDWEQSGSQPRKGTALPRHCTAFSFQEVDPLFAAGAARLHAQQAGRRQRHRDHRQL